MFQGFGSQGGLATAEFNPNLQEALNQQVQNGRDSMEPRAPQIPRGTENTDSAELERVLQADSANMTMENQNEDSLRQDRNDRDLQESFGHPQGRP